MRIVLTPQQKQQLEEMHDSTRDGRVRDCIKAVLHASEGLESDDDFSSASYSRIDRRSSSQ